MALKEFGAEGLQRQRILGESYPDIPWFIGYLTKNEHVLCFSPPISCLQQCFFQKITIPKNWSRIICTENYIPPFCGRSIALMFQVPHSIWSTDIMHVQEPLDCRWSFPVHKCCPLHFKGRSIAMRAEESALFSQVNTILKRKGF